MFVVNNLAILGGQLEYVRAYQLHTCTLSPVKAHKVLNPTTSHLICAFGEAIISCRVRIKRKCTRLEPFRKYPARESLSHNRFHSAGLTAHLFLVAYITRTVSPWIVEIE